MYQQSSTEVLVSSTAEYFPECYCFWLLDAVILLHGFHDILISDFSITLKSNNNNKITLGHLQ